MTDSDSAWVDIVVSPKTTIIEAISILNQTGKMFLLIADDDLRLLGNLTDGDLRKGLLKFNNLATPISKIMNSSPKTVFTDTLRDEISILFQGGSLKALPIINKNNILQGCYFETSFKNSSELPSEIIIMAGGFGKRMGDLTKDLPKPMLAIDEKPILEHLIARAKYQGFVNIYVSVYYQAEKIISYFGNGQAFGVNIEYLRESEPLGTGGSIKLLPDGNGPVIVTNADIISSINFRALVDFHVLTKATATMVTHEHNIENPFGVVHANGSLIWGLEEKPIWTTNVNAGIYVIERNVSEFLDANEQIDMPQIFQRLLDVGKTVIQYPTPEKIFEIGTVEKYNHFVRNSKKLLGDNNDVSD
jgi:dTDP-glucose pyrophosphorylase